MWRACREARLFEDVEYGQWGLALLSPIASKEMTEEEILSEWIERDEVVIGKSIGDQELVILAPSKQG